MMLTNLKWLDGGHYPPQAEKERIERYRLNERLFLSEHSEALRERFKEIANRSKKKNNKVETVINYQQFLSIKTADFICGEPPEFESEQDTDNLDKLLDNQRWGVRLYEAFIDVSRFGNAVMKLVDKRLTAVSPQYWFPIVEPSDLKTITQHVIAYPISPNEKGIMTELYVEIHDIGKVEQRTYSYNGNTGQIGEINAVLTANTGLDDYAVQTLTNVTHSGSIYGVDDYAIVNSIIEKIMWRLHCIDNVLDKHSEPSLSGPGSALTYDDKFKTYYLDLGSYFMRNSNDDPDLQYITWDGNLESAYKEIDLLMEQLYTLSEMGQAFMQSGGGGEANSGTALKLRMVSPRIKAARLASINQAAIKKVITLLAKINGIPLDYDGLTIHWSDGLPNDEVEQIQTLTTATGGKPVMSQYAAMKRLGLTDTEVESELEQLRVETVASAPSMLGLFKSGEDENE